MACAVPSFPAQLTALELAEIIIADGAVRVTDALAAQPLLSTTVTTYIPAVNPVAVAVV